jgi:formylglycine-generating enzyme required for sulfatase activity
MSDWLKFEFDQVTVDAQGQEIDRRRGSARYRRIDLGQNTILDMVAVPGGAFLRGAPASEAGWSQAQSPQGWVTVPPFAIGKYPVTQAQWQTIAALSIDAKHALSENRLKPDPSNCKGANRPVEQISWQDAIEFCARLSHLTGQHCRLPSEAEWEYACRAGTTTPFHFGETCTTDLANYSGVDWEYEGRVLSRGTYADAPQGVDRRETTPVDHFLFANSFGLYDMHGNVREWCADSWHVNYLNAPIDGSAWVTGGDDRKRVVRGGSWNVSPNCCRSAYRSRFDVDGSLYDIGFRVVCS